MAWKKQTLFSLWQWRKSWCRWSFCSDPKSFLCQSNNGEHGVYSFLPHVAFVWVKNRNETYLALQLPWLHYLWHSTKTHAWNIETYKWLMFCLCLKCHTELNTIWNSRNSISWVKKIPKKQKGSNSLKLLAERTGPKAGGKSSVYTMKLAFVYAERFVSKPRLS